MRKIVFSTQFKKDSKKAKCQNLPMEELNNVLKMLVFDTPLPAKYRDHQLSGDYKGCRECHILPDWLLIYQKTENKENEIHFLHLIRLGSHSELF